MSVDEPIGYVVFFGHEDGDEPGKRERAGFEFYERHAQARASHVGNGATYEPVYVRKPEVLQSDEPVQEVKPGDCTHPNDSLDRRRYDGNHTVCHACKTHILVGTVHYANGRNEAQQYTDLVEKLNRASIAANEPIKLPNGVLGVCTNCGQWQRGRHSDATVDCFNECRKRGLV